MASETYLTELYTHQSTYIHRLDARAKLLIVIGYILTLMAIPMATWYAYGIMFLLWSVGALMSRLSLRKALTRSLIAAPFLMTALTLLLRPSTPILIQHPIGPWQITLGAPSVYRFLTVTLRSWLGILATILLLHTTTVPDLLTALESLRIPSTLTTILNMAYRYLFILLDEAKRLARARAARSAAATPPHRSPGLKWRAHVTGLLIGTLFIRSLQRSENVYYAMLSRGYRGGAWKRPTTPWGTKETRLLLCCTVIYILIVYITRR